MRRTEYRSSISSRRTESGLVVLEGSPSTARRCSRMTPLLVERALGTKAGERARLSWTTPQPPRAARGARGNAPIPPDDMGCDTPLSQSESSVGSARVVAVLDSVRTPSVASGNRDVSGLRALDVLNQVELHPLSWAQVPAAFHLDVGVVNEDVLATTIRRDESEALL